jgi:(S)-citramalyl-CoA lyase
LTDKDASEPHLRIRSWLCASALKGDLALKASQVSADIAHLDLEDAVPDALKDRARRTLPDFFAKPRGVPVALRINPLHTLDGLRDLLFVAEHGLSPDVLILSKIVAPGDISQARAVIDQAGLFGVRLFGAVESVRALWDLRNTPHLPGLDGLIFGAADFAADVGVSLEDNDFAAIRQEIVLIARRLGVAAIDSPCFRLNSEAALNDELHLARRVGFDGKIAIHPAQVAAINASFEPTEKDLDKAREILRMHDENPQDVAFSFDGAMVGPPFIRRARRLLQASKESLSQPSHRGSK